MLKNKPTTNRHHILFEKRDYKSRDEKKFRCMEGLVIPLNIEVHKFLHLAVPPPPKPMKVEMGEAREFIADRDAWAHVDNPYWAVEALMQYYVYRGADQPQHAERASQMRYNLAQQIGIMSNGHTIERPI